MAWRSNIYGYNLYQHVSTANGVVYVMPGGGPLVPLPPGGAESMLLAFDASR